MTATAERDFDAVRATWAEYVAHLLDCTDCTAEHCTEGQRLHDASEHARFRWAHGRAA